MAPSHIQDEQFKEGQISALQLKRELWGEHKGSYESAWFMAHRIREAMKERMTVMLRQTVEADETYVGGKRKHEFGKPFLPKTAVMVLVERGKKGRARSVVIADVTKHTVQEVLQDNILQTATINTDESQAYNDVKNYFYGGHNTVNHSKGEYVRYESKNGGRAKKITTNTAEAYFALFKRGIHGTFHSLSKKHLQRYANEFAFRWSYRNITDAERAVKAILGAEGRRLTYRQQS